MRSGLMGRSRPASSAAAVREKLVTRTESGPKRSTARRIWRVRLVVLPVPGHGGPKMRNSRVSSAPASAVSWIVSVCQLELSGCMASPPAREVVQSGMFGLGEHHFQVLRAVVTLVAVDVVHYFARHQLPADLELSQDPVNMPTVELHVPVSRRITLPPLHGATLELAATRNLGVHLRAAAPPPLTQRRTEPLFCLLADRREDRSAPLARSRLRIRQCARSSLALLTRHGDLPDPPDRAAPRSRSG